MKSGPRRVPLLPLSSFVVPSSRIKKKKKKNKKRNRRKREKSKKGERTVVYGFPMVCRRKTISRQDNHCSHPPFFRWYASTLALALFSPIFLSFSLYYPFFYCPSFVLFSPPSRSFFSCILLYFMRNVLSEFIVWILFLLSLELEEINYRGRNLIVLQQTRIFGFEKCSH